MTSNWISGSKKPQLAVPLTVCDTSGVQMKGGQMKTSTENHCLTDRQTDRLTDSANLFSRVIASSIFVLSGFFP